MEYITLQDFEENFDFILDDVQAGKVHYQIELPNGNAVVLLPAEDYQFLKNTYEDWIK
jgi:PHD/YefM family antitoxin component YafN of YafNO toxin-antitoxin module